MTPRILAAALLLILAGCTTTPRLQTVKVAVPVQCAVQVPDRPAMPTEALAPGVALFDYVKASQSEIERREGYEGQLREALAACVSPVVEPDPAP